MAIYNNVRGVVFNGFDSRAASTIKVVDLNNVPLENNKLRGVIGGGEIFINNLTTVKNVSDTVTNMEGGYVARSNLTTIPDHFPPNINSLADTFFWANKIENIPAIPNSVTNMYLTFCNCWSLKNLPPELPPNVTNYSSTFERCMNLVQAPNINGAKAVNCMLMFSDCRNLAHLNISIGPNLTCMSSMFWGCNKLTDLNFTYTDYNNTTNVKSADSMFTWCNKLVNFPDLPPSIETMNSTFYNCTNLTTFNCPSTVTSMNTAFYNCVNVQQFTIPNSVSDMYQAFTNCRKLTQAIIPTSVSGSLANTFYDCRNITSLSANIPVAVQNMEQTFYNCKKITGNIYIESRNIEEAYECFGNTTNNKDVYIQLASAQERTETLYCWALNDEDEVFYTKKNLHGIGGKVYDIYDANGNRIYDRYSDIEIYEYEESGDDPHEGRVIVQSDGSWHYIHYVASEDITRIIPAGSNTLTYDSFLAAGYSTTERKDGVLLKELGINYYTITINPTPADATVELRCQQYQQINKSISVPEGLTVYYTVTAPGYIEQRGSIIADNDITKNIELSTEFATYTINPIPQDATVTFTTGGQTYTVNTITVPVNTILTWEVSKSGYTTKSGTKRVTITESETVELTQSLIRYTINATPNNSTINLTCPGYTKVDNYIDVPFGSTVTWQVSCSGYVTQSGTTLITATKTDTVTLVKLYTLTISPIPQNSTVELTSSVQGYTQSGNSITVPNGTSVHYKVSYSGYEPEEGDKVVTTDSVVSVTLGQYATFTINATPMNATITLTASSYKDKGVNWIKVPIGTTVSWEVSATRYWPQSGSEVIDETKVLNVELMAYGNYSLDITDYAYTNDDNNLVLTKYIGNGTNVTMPNIGA